MNLSCMLGRHWPIAAFEPARHGFEKSRCADCGVDMVKHHWSDWRSLEPVRIRGWRSLFDRVRLPTQPRGQAR